MTDEQELQIRREIKKYFNINELVGGRTYRRHGERAWKYLDIRLLEALLIIRKNLDRPITVNRGRLEQRGLRTTAQQMIKNKVYKNILYISAHLLGKAVDFDVKGMTAKQVRQWIRENEHLFPNKIRIEGRVSWVHIDTIWEEKNPKVYTFQP